jgi:hypothetical protein
MIKHGLPTLLVKIFVLSDLPYSYSYIEKDLLSTQKAWIPLNMDFNIVFDMNILDMQIYFFMMTMIHNAQWAIKWTKTMDFNPMLKFRNISSNALLCV